MIPKENLDISNGEKTSIDEYIKRKNTSVLVVMFTDIEGFTRITEEKGDSYASELRGHHDEILRKIIEENDAGLVIKTIGDAFMAVFSEPTTALERALIIQERLAEFNKSNQDKYNELRVRIGLHMGQVVIENKIKTDVFGRHVNRASRVEGLAEGGQVFLTYSVFDSAKGWLADKNNLEWKNHGLYYLKGIDDAIDIYEVYNKDITTPKPPKKGRKKRSFPKWIYLILFMLIGGGITLMLLQIQKTDLNLVHVGNNWVFIDDGKKLYLKKDPETNFARPEGKVSPGKHLIYFDVSRVSRYWAVIEVKRGKNIIKPRFTEIHLPSVQVNAQYREEKNRLVTRERTYPYYILDHTYERKEMKAVLKVTASVEKDIKRDEAIFTITWSCSLNGEKIGGDIIKARNPVSETNRKRFEPVIFYEDDFHFYFYEYSMNRDTIQFEIDCQFIRYK